jgi:uncharacterized phage infection (PIP) family protein YhgE
MIDQKIVTIASDERPLSGSEPKEGVALMPVDDHLRVLRRVRDDAEKRIKAVQEQANGAVAKAYEEADAAVKQTVERASEAVDSSREAVKAQAKIADARVEDIDKLRALLQRSNDLLQAAQNRTKEVDEAFQAYQAQARDSAAELIAQRELCLDSAEKHKDRAQGFASLLQEYLAQHKDEASQEGSAEGCFCSICEGARRALSVSKS